MIAVFCFLAHALQPEAACSDGFSLYNNATEWLAALKGSTGKHCLEGMQGMPISVDRQVWMDGGMEVEAHHVDFMGSGDLQEFGGLVRIEGAAFTATSCSFTNGKTVADSGIGGAVYVGQSQDGTGESSFECKDCTFADNEGGSTGGGVFVDNLGTFDCTNCGFQRNTAQAGGGIFNNNGGTTTCATCVFDGNVATHPIGGGAAFNLGTMTLSDDCTFLTESDTVYEYDMWGILLGLGGASLACCCCCGIGLCAMLCYCCSKDTARTPPPAAQMQPQQVQMQQGGYSNPGYSNPGYTGQMGAPLAAPAWQKQPQQFQTQQGQMGAPFAQV